MILMFDIELLNSYIGKNSKLSVWPTGLRRYANSPVQNAIQVQNQIKHLALFILFVGFARSSMLNISF